MILSFNLMVILVMVMMMMMNCYDDAYDDDDLFYQIMYNSCHPMQKSHKSSEAQYTISPFP